MPFITSFREAFAFSMLTIPILDNRQLTEFYCDGFVIVRNAFSPKEMQQIESWTSELAALPEEGEML